MPKVHIGEVPGRRGVGYPEPFAALSAHRLRQKLGDAGGLTDFGVNITRLPPGEWSSQRHWHSHKDEFVFPPPYGCLRHPASGRYLRQG